MYLFKQTKLFISMLLFMCFSAWCQAKTLNLYEQPKADAKVVASIESSNGMVPIFTPKDSDWMKVGDPQNGNVGWIKLEDLADNSGSLATQFSMTQKTISTKSGPKTIQVVTFSTPKTLSNEQSQLLMKQMQAREDNLQKSVQKMMQNFYQDMNNYYMANPAMFGTPNMPVVLPIIVYPQDAPTVIPRAHSSNVKMTPNS